MKTLMYLGTQNIQVQEAPEPEGSFIVHALGVAICGTDLKTYLKGHPFFKPPTILGHEAIGQVVKAPGGSGYHPGDILVIPPYGNCGECEMCKKDLGELCTAKHFIPTGMFVERFAVPEALVSNGLIKLNKYERAFVLTEPLACVVCGAEKIEIGPDNRLVIVGGGPMGALFAKLGQDLGAQVMVSEPNFQRRQMLKQRGIPCATPEEVLFKNYDRAVIAVNLPEVAGEVISSIAPGARVNVFSGMPSGSSITVDADAIHYRAVSVTGSSGYALRHFRRAYEIIAKNPDSYDSLITNEYPLERAAEAFMLLSEGKAFKVLLKP